MKKYTLFILLIIGSFIFNFSTISAYKYKTSTKQLTASKLSAKFQEPKAKSITLASPNGAEIWKAGSIQVIKWASSEINFVTLSYSTNNGISWTNIESNIAASLWQYQWNIPENITPSQEFRIRIFDDSDPTVFDISDNPFILSKLKILSPVTGVSFQTSRVDTIKWLASSDINLVNIEISFNNGVWQTIANNYDASLAKFEYTVPDNPSSFNRIRISNSAIPSITTTSDYFRIAKILLSAPNGGEDWFNNSTHSILWNSSSITSLGLSYSTDNGVTWILIADSVSAALNSYSWLIPPTASSQALIKVFDSNDTSIYDLSNSTFTISTLSIISPNELTGWAIGANQNITWTSNLSGNVKIEITTNNGTSWTQIATGIPVTQGVYTYTVANTPTNKAKVKITSLDNSSYTAISNSFFTIGNINIIRPSGGEIFRAGDIEQILWSNTTGINLIKIEYSSDGIVWNLITANAQSSLGRYDWAIPANLNSANAYIRLSDGESDAGLSFVSSSFSINNIIINFPVGNEVFKGGTTQNIKWVASPSISNVRIDYRLDDNSNWKTITNSTSAALGNYFWNIPDSLSTIACKIRIRSTSDTAVSSISEGYFKIGNLQIITPNGGEKLVGNANYNIRWSSTNSVNYVRLQYSLDGGVNYINIPNASSYPANAGLFPWSVPNILTSNAKIRILDSDSPVIFDNSDADFSIAELSLTYPNGGEGFLPGTPINITWTSTNITGVTIDYSVVPNVWINIVSNISAALGSYAWVIPNQPSSSVQIRITATENSELFDICDRNFKIGSVVVLSPNGNEIYQAGINKEIRWNASSGVDRVNIDLTTNNGTSWINVISNYLAGSGKYVWTVTNAPSANAKIRVSDFDYPNISDMSENPFSIKNISVIYPNGGNFFLVDSTVEITWQPYNIANVKLEYSTDHGVFWNPIINSVPSVPSKYLWNVPNQPSDRVLIRISDADFPAAKVSDSSDHNFSINLVYVIFPDGGQSFVVNSDQNVKWVSHNSVANIKLEYTTTNGTSWVVVQNSIPAAPQQYLWTIPNTPTSQGLVRVTSTVNSAVTDVSNSQFSIGSILLTSPNGGERWQVGSTHTIKWNNIVTVNNVDLDYTTNQGETWLPIVSNYNATLESYSWIIPNTVSAFAKVRIKNSTNATLFDVSNNVFSICSILVTSPNGSEIYQVGENLPITWASNNINFIFVEYSTNNGNNWEVLNGGNPINASDGIFNYTLPDYPTQSGLIRVRDTQDNNIYDVSNNLFSVYRLDLISPNGGESYKIGSTQLIRWNSSGVNSVSIKYSTNNGINWLGIIDNVIGVNGVYNWLVPNIPTNNFKIKIYDKDNTFIKDSSDTGFTIGDIVVTKPDSGEVLLAHTVKRIEWTVTPGIQNVNIELQPNSVSPWETIEPFANAQQGFYNWLVSDNASTSAKIRVSDAVVGTSITDESEPFLINTIHVVAPNGGEYWQAGKANIITWTSSVTGNLKIEYSSDNGTTWHLVIGSVPAVNNQYSWNTPANLSSRHVLVKITDINALTIFDYSDNVFKVGDVSIISPIGSEYWQSNSVHEISFSASNSIDEVTIQYTLDNITWQPIVSNYPVTSGKYNWALGNLSPSNVARIRVFDANSALGIVAVSNTFNIIELNVLSPNGNEYWQSGTLKNITWSTSLTSNLKIEYSADNGNIWNTISGSVPAPNLGYAWNIPANLSSKQVKVKLTDLDHSSIIDSSDLIFKIGTVKILNPVGGENWQTGSQKIINFSTSGSVEEVNIEYTLDNITWNTIASHYPVSTGTFTWGIGNISASSNARIRISDAESGLSIISSSNTFNIINLKVDSPNGGEFWQAGTAKNITWSSSITGNLKIEYSSNNGGSWNSVIASIAASNNSYSWNIPAALSSKQVKIKIINLDAPNIVDSSDAVFKVGNVSIVSPVGGEYWQIGTQKVINFSTSNSVNEIDIFYTLDNITWIPIALRYPVSSGTYNWSIGNISASNNARIRISDSESGLTIVSTSNTFNIVNLKVDSPNGGEFWQAGTIKNITWTSSVPGNLKIDYSSNNGSSWNNIIASILASNNSYSWNIPVTLSSKQVKIRIINLDTPSIADSSDSAFKIGNVTITSPIGNEYWQIGTQQVINFSTSGSVDEVDIYYSLDNITWTPIVLNHPAITGVYTWNMLNLSPSTNARIRVNDAASGLSISSLSNTFNIVNLNIVSPNGAELWQTETIQNIKWLSSSHIPSVNIYYSDNNGTSWNLISSSYPSVSNDTNKYAWNIPSGISSSQMLIKVESFNNILLKDVSNNPFSIGNLIVTSPTNADKLQSGRQKTITWNSTKVGNIKIEYSLDNGVTWQPDVIISSINSDLHMYNWTVPDTISSSHARIRLSSLSNKGAVSVSNPFVISLLEVVAPNGGEFWLAGSTKLIKWNSNQINSLSIYSSDNNGQLWNLIASNVPAVNKQFSWVIPTNSVTNSAKILLVDESNIIIRDSSSLSFSINSLKLASPIGGDIWQAGTTKQIKWNGLNLGQIELFYSLNNGTNWSKIIDNISGSVGNYNWIIPQDTASNQVRIKIREMLDTTNYDISDLFTINRLQLLVPNGGENWQAGSTKKITWYSKYINNISLAYSIDNGLNWINIADNIAGNAYNINWNIPSNITTENAKIKIWDTSNPVFKDSSETRFIISNIGIIAPAGNAQLLAGAPTTISWNASNLGIINILYSIDNGTTWDTVKSNVPSTANSIIWNIPSNIATNQALVRLQSVTDPSIRILSSNFIISNLVVTTPNGSEIWQSGSLKLITWQSQFVNNINIYYSLNNGSTWTEIVNNIPAVTNNFSWTIPANITSNSSLIKIEDTNNSAIKDSSNTIFTIGLLSITSPINGEQVQAGTNKNITWNSSNLGLINIDYSIDNGATWNEVAKDVLASDLHYNWSVPDVFSTLAKIRLSYKNDVSISSTSSTFVISSLTLLTPNGGEVWQAGTTKSITWQSQNIANVNLDYSLDNGTNWISIASNIAINPGLYSWNIPASLSSSVALIRISDYSNAAIKDISNSRFTISQLQLTSPVGGEKWQAGTAKTITWTGSNLNNIKVEYSIDNGATWDPTPIVSSIAMSLNSVQWIIPENLVSNQVKIKLTSLDNPSISSTGGQFTLSSLKVVAPNGSERWQSGTTENITWQSQFINNINIYYSINKGSSYTLIANNIASGLGTYSWVIPSNIATSNAVVKIIDSDNNSIIDTSDNIFTIGILGITSPTSADVWQAGKQYNINWVANTTNQSLKIEYSRDGGATWELIPGANNVPTVNGTYLWTIPSTEGTSTAKVRISDITSKLVYQSPNFVIKQLDLSSPNGGQYWTSGTSRDIEWISSQIASVKIEYSVNNGTSWNEIVNSTPALTGKYTWNIPAELVSPVMKIKISDAGNSQINDMSDNTFVIGSIKVVDPNGGEVLQAGVSYNIKWTNSASIDNVIIDYSIDNGVNWSSVTNSTPADGEYIWSVPSGLSTNSGLIRIADYNSSSSIIDISNANFSIANLSLLSPDGNASYQVGKTINIEWTASNNIANVTIEYFTETKGWKLIASNIAANSSPYLWVIPNDPSDSTRIRIKSSLNNQVFDISNNSFRIANLTVLSPNNLVRWQSGTLNSVQWSKTSNIKNVNLDYSVDGGTNWKSIISNYSSINNTYNWLVPADTTFNAKIRVVDASSSGAISDISDVNFIINTLSVIKPDGIEPWLSGSIKTIEWISTADIDSVYINLSIDGGTTWSLLNKIKANVGVYSWTIPQLINSNNAFILIKDTKLETIRDTSNKFIIIPANLSLTYPVGGEYLQEGKSYNIGWTKSSNVNNVKIEFTSDGGANWVTIKSSYPADSLKFNWKVPENTFTNLAKIKITDVQNSFITSTSTTPFTIAALQLTSQLGSENYQVGTSQNITWNASANIPFVNIEYSTIDGIWKLIAQNIAANLGTYVWLIPNDPSNTIKIRIRSSLSTQINSSNIEYFRIANILVTEPNVYQKWQVGSMQQIKWNSTANIQKINIYYTSNNGIVWNPIVTDTLASTGVYNWIIPDNPNTTTRIKVVDALAADFINDISDNDITITKLKITNPLGGENWLSGDTQPIKWTSSTDIDSVGIYLSLDGGNIWSLITKQKANTNQYNWTIPQSLNSNNVLIKIKDTKFENIVSTSNSLSITYANLSLIYPVGGEYLQEGKSYFITGTKSANISDIKLEFTLDNGLNWTTIPASPNLSTSLDSLKYKWIVPANTFTNLAKIRISEANNSFISSTSNATFTIAALKLTSQTGSENYQVGTTQSITWNASANIPLVNIEYNTDNGVWKTIAQNIAANLGTYSWLIPNDPSNIVNIRVRSSETSSIAGISASSVRIADVLVTNPNIFQKWQVGSVKQIKWNSTSNVQNINIYFSTNNGLVWNPVVTNTVASSGVYNWLIPDYPNTSTRIKIVDALAANSINDVNDTVIVISKLQINEPIGGEIWASGSTQQLQWTASNDIDSIGIYLSLDGGNVWSSITKQKANIGAFTWVIPQSINSSNVLVMMKDTKFESVKDTSGSLTIYPPVLTVTSPNGGEYLQAGSKYYIKWQSSADVNNIKIEFRQNAADTVWSVLENSYPADSLQYLWTIPLDISTNAAKIRITDVMQPFIVDSSDNFFKIGWVLVQSPNGGEHIQSGKKIDINWLTSANITNVKIEYTINGNIWTTIVPSIAANIGTYKWTIPNTPSAFARIKISDALSNNTIKDLSDTDFTISLLQLTTPASSIQLQAGTNYQIKWNSSPEINYVNLEYTLDGTVWNIISQDSIQASVGEYLWQIPDNLCSTQGKIRIWDNSSAGINDTSKYLITFKMLNLTSPIGGENWQVGTTKAIRWNACQVDTITIEYSINNGQNWLLVSENIPTLGNIYNWTVPNTVSSNVLVRLVDKTNPQLLAVSNRFSIFNPSINLVTPNGGETWQSGTTKTIEWQSNLIDFVKIEFSSDSGATWSTLRSSISADSSYSWFIQNNLETHGAVIRVSDVVNPHIKDTSEVFTITELRLTSPMGGEYWQSGTQKNITWHAGSGINLVRLQYSLDNGQNWTNIAEAQNIIASVDTFKWNIPITLGTNIAKIRVMDIVDQTINSTSVDTFTIGWVRVITPNGGNVFQSGHSVNVTWECSGNLRKVNVEIYNPSTNQVVVESEANASLKTINLVIPSNYFSDSLVVRISEVNSNYLISDVSDNLFSTKALELMRPVFGDNWKAGTTETIKWEASSNNNTVNILYTSNNGVTWNPIVTNYSAALGEYDWQIPNNLSSDKCIIKIYNSFYTNVKDSSGLFNIYVPGLSLISPNGNNYYQAGNTYKIQWSSSFVTAAAIEFSSDNGVTWDTLKAPIQASLGEWDWQIPNRVSTNLGLIRISDYSNNAVKDVSDATFVVGWIEVISPDGGENWLSNSSNEIRWENSSSISLINIYYSNGDNGIDTNWVLLTTNHPAANMPYIWQQIPNKETNRGKIKITDAKSNNKIANESNDYFSITKLYVLSPNGGEVWYSGNAYKITWTPSININGLKIELSTNGGKTWGVNITSSTPASTGFYDWAIDGSLYSDSSLIRLTDVEHNEIIDVSDGLFTLGAIQLRTFDNEEKVLEGSNKLITWLNSANIKFVDLLYRTKDKVWKPIKFRVPANDEQYNWIIPSEPSDSCYITIRNSDNFIFNDTSNKPFVICRMKFGSPNGGEIWQTGTTKEITWQSLNVSQVYLEYSVDTTVIPITWTKIVNQPILASLGKYSWEIPDDINLAGKNYRFRIYDINESEVADTSNSYSTLSYLRLLTPNNGEQTGTSQIIKWSNNVNTISKVNIYIQREISDFNWTVIARNVNSDPSSYLWNINIDPSQTCRIKVEDSQNNNVYDVSDIPFTVCSIKLISPNGGKYQKLQIGKTYDITWETSFINIVRLEFSTNNGQSWNLVPNANSIPASEKRFAWYMDDIPSRNTRLRISDANKETIYDVSDTTFTICSLNLLQPNTLTAYQVGQTYDITWQSVNIDSVRIQLSIDDGKNWSNLVGISDADSGRFRWEVPNLLSALARIRISDFYEIGVNDTSNSNFVIGKYPNVVLYKPYQSNVIKFIYDFLTPQETIIIERFEYQIGEGAIINTLQSLIDPPVNITGPQTDTLYWRSTDNLLNYEGPVKVWVTFRSPQYNVTYKVLVDTVGVDNKAPLFVQSKVTLYQKPDKFGWNKVIAKWEKGTDLSDDIRYKLSFNDINNEYINYLKETNEDSLIIPNVWSSVNYLIKLDVSDVYNNTSSYILPNFKSVATCDFSGDNELNSLDLAAYIKSWTSKDSTIGADLAPYDGAYPIIKVRGDNKLNIEDLLVFVNMWNYGQEYTLPKMNVINYYDKSVEREQITFKRGENNFSFPINYDKKEDLIAITAEIHYQPDVFKFDSLKIKGLIENTGLAFIKNDTINGVMKIDFAELDGKLDADYSLSTVLQYAFDRVSKEDSLMIKYTGYNNNLVKVFDKSIVYSMHEIPAQYKLYQNYPNPFNPTTIIEYDLPEKTKVNLVIFDILGREVASLVNEEQNVGTYRVQFDSHKLRGGLASGVYFYRIHTQKYTLTQKMLLLK
ncbi:MAG: T9SS type A sorting domain-containing protein [bacterium]